MNMIAFWIVVGIITLLYSILFVKDLNNIMKQIEILKLIQFLLFSIITFLLVISNLELKDARDKLKNKCPELERIENVYRIK